ncbi:long-chain fatty acid--CoA ligase [Amycolatopsis sp. K13G38]|uniref:Long-chain fatty acid--CoA ligase n=1 Tax=Amycolatopsis acididurans TaxID=2724524 RepID=A0ABX1IZQ5_9PSEU|nr:fatty acid--CoA ligase family protein [Amycolatopsis acididurans]NKQ51595.1 long-chain fatty acid--CoA ligase [Amycolatopsis acididurans]
MNLAMILDMVAEGMPERVLIGDKRDGLTAAAVRAKAIAGAERVQAAGADRLVHLGPNGPGFPLALFSAVFAGVPFLPVNYRLSEDQLGDILSRSDNPLVVTDTPERVAGGTVLGLDEFLALSPSDSESAAAHTVDPDSVAVLLMTSGTTAAPKSAVLRHRNLASYLFGSVEFASAEPDDATLVSVPPYHIAAVANILSNLYAGRRIVYLDRFTAPGWLDLVAGQGITHAMVVPTMLVRIVGELKSRGTRGPASLRSISYGGAKISAAIVEDALRLLPSAGFVNAYGLTETASSVAVLGPEDHREALAATDPAVRARLGSVGRALPSVEIEVHDEDGKPVEPGVVGEIVVRGPQVSGEYVEKGTQVRPDGWFPTRDQGYLDEEGYLFVRGRADDTIIRGGENIAPAEIEEVLAGHPAVLDCVVAGIPDIEWGHRIGAFIVLRQGETAEPDVLRTWVRERLRGSKTPEEIVFVDELPTSATGKVLRRELIAAHQAAHGQKSR